MTDWIPMVVMPNVFLREAVEMPDIILAPATDHRVRSACREQPKLREFFGRFRDEFGVKVDVSLLMLRNGLPERYRATGPIAGFRDVIAASALLTGRALLISHSSRMQKPIWAECLTFYPWMLGVADDDHLYAFTQTMQGVHSLDKFKGQTIPGFGPEYIDRGDIDGPLLNGLSAKWATRFDDSEPSWADRAIFRSLNMAYNACMTPGGQETQYYDVGRLLVLWTSAMEILVHSGPDGNSPGASGKQQVMDMLEGVDWYDDRLTVRQYDVRVGRETQVRSLPAKLYSQVDALRNKFIHGNDVRREDLVTESGAQYLHLAAVLYRECLAAKLNIRRPAFADDDESREFDQEQFLQDFEQYVEWKNPRTRFERAIFAAAGLPEEGQ